VAEAESRYRISVRSRGWPSRYSTPQAASAELCAQWVVLLIIVKCERVVKLKWKLGGLFRDIYTLAYIRNSPSWFRKINLHPVWSHPGRASRLTTAHINIDLACRATRVLGPCRRQQGINALETFLAAGLLWRTSNNLTRSIYSFLPCSLPLVTSSSISVWDGGAWYCLNSWIARISSQPRTCVIMKEPTLKRSSAGNPLLGSQYTDSQKMVLHILALIFVSVSILSTMLTIYWILTIRRSFRH
jgi:hypothetical protein